MAAVRRSMTSAAHIAVFPPMTVRRAFLIAMVCWLLFAITAALVVAGRTDAFDAHGLLAWGGENAASPFLDEAMRDITALGGVLLRNLIALGGVTVLILLGLRRDALWLAATVLLGWLANSGAKLLFARARPDIVPHLMEVSGAGFPSGHSFNGTVVCFALALTFMGLSERRGTRPIYSWAILAIAILVSLAIAWSRVWLGVHFPTDVIAGWLGGAGWTFLAAALAQRAAQPPQASAGNITENRPLPRAAKRASPTSSSSSSPTNT